MNKDTLLVGLSQELIFTAVPRPLSLLYCPTAGSESQRMEERASNQFMTKEGAEMLGTESRKQATATDCLAV